MTAIGVATLLRTSVTWDSLRGCFLLPFIKLNWLSVIACDFLKYVSWRLQE